MTMKIHGLLAFGIQNLRNLWTLVKKHERGKTPLDSVIAANAYSEYMGVLIFLAEYFQVDKWYLDKLRACNDLICEV